MSGYISSFFCNLIALPYPIYRSFKAIETTEKEDDTQWLTFWVVFAVVTLFESMTDIFVWWVPFYFEVKLAFLLLLQAPGLNLAQGIYLGTIKPYLLSNEPAIDHVMSNTVHTVTSAVTAGVSRTLNTRASRPQQLMMPSDSSAAATDDKKSF